MYINPNSPIELHVHLDLQLAKNKYVHVYHRILCNSKDNIMLTFLFFVTYDNIYQQDIDVQNGYFNLECAQIPAECKLDAHRLFQIEISAKASDIWFLFLFS